MLSRPCTRICVIWLVLAIFVAWPASSEAGVYQPQTGLDLGVDATALVLRAVDIDGDGVSELLAIIGTENGGLRVYRWNETSQSYEEVPSENSDEPGGDEMLPTGFAFADVDADYPGTEIIFTIIGEDNEVEGNFIGIVEVFAWDAGESRFVRTLRTTDLIQHDDGGFLVGPVIADVDGDGVTEIVVAVARADSANFETIEDRLDNNIDDPFVAPLFRSRLVVLEHDGAVASTVEIGNGAAYLLAAGQLDSDDAEEIVVDVADLDYDNINQLFNDISVFDDQFDSQNGPTSSKALTRFFEDLAPVTKMIFNDAIIPSALPDPIARVLAGGALQQATDKVTAPLFSINGSPLAVKPLANQGISPTDPDFIRTRTESALSPPFPELPSALFHVTLHALNDGSVSALPTRDGLDLNLTLTDLDDDGLDEIAVKTIDLNEDVINGIIDDLQFVKVTETETSRFLDENTGEPRHENTNIFPEPQHIPGGLTDLPITGAVSLFDGAGAQLWTHDAPTFSVVTPILSPLKVIDFGGLKRLVVGSVTFNLGHLNVLLAAADEEFQRFRVLLPDSTYFFFPNIPAVPDPLFTSSLQYFTIDGLEREITQGEILTSNVVGNDDIVTATLDLDYAVINQLLAELDANGRQMIAERAGPAWTDSLTRYNQAMDAVIQIHNNWAQAYWEWSQNPEQGPPPEQPPYMYPEFPEGEPDFEAPEAPTHLAGSTIQVYDHLGTLTWSHTEPEPDIFAVGLGSAAGYRIDGDTLTDVAISRLEIGFDIEEGEPDTLRGGILVLLAQPPPEVARGPTFLTQPTATSITDSTVTLTWDTDKESDSQALIGTTRDALTGQVVDPTRVTAHSLRLPGLLPNTLYFVKARSRDREGNTTESRLFSFTTLASSDTLPPVIVEGPVLSYTTDNRVAVEWRTDEPATGKVYYREGGTSTVLGPVILDLFDTFHQAILTGLTPGASYDYAVISTDPSGNRVVFDQFNVLQSVTTKITQIPGGRGRFSTNTQPDTQAPIILRGPTIAGRDASTLTITWETDEISNSEIEFGVTDTLGQTTTSTVSVRQHQMTIANLEAATGYRIRVGSTDPTGNGATRSQVAVATTLDEADVTPPQVVGGPTVTTVSTDRATITWETDEVSNSAVRFGTGGMLTSWTASSANVKSHRIIVTNLTADTEYSYRVESSDLAGNGPVQSAVLTLRTLQAPDQTPPQITDVKVQTVTQISGNDTVATALFTWTTDEAANSFVEAVAQGTTDTLAVGNADQIIRHQISLGDLIPGARYLFVVGSEDATRNLAQAAVDTFDTDPAPDVAPPAVPTGLVTQAGQQTVRLQWQSNTEVDFNGYIIQRQIRGVGNPDTLETGVTDTLYLDTGLTEDTAYLYQIAAVDLVGNTSAFTDTVGATPTTSAAPTSPANPRTVRSGIPAERVSLKPNLVVDSASPSADRPSAPLTYTYVVYGDSALTAVIASVSGIPGSTPDTPVRWQVTNPSLPDSIALLHDTRYYWRARANDGVVNSPWSPKATFVADTTQPVAVELVNFIALSSEGHAVLEWETGSVRNHAGFHVLRGATPNGPFAVLTREFIPEQPVYRYVDATVQVNRTYYYLLEAVGTDGQGQRFGPFTLAVAPPRTFRLYPNAPNPFNPATTIRFDLPKSAQVTLVVYNMLGQEVNRLLDNETMEAGFHQVTWHGRNQAGRATASGVYLFRIKTDGFVKARKMLLLK